MISLIDPIPTHDATKIMLVGIISLLLVLFFVILLHCYAKRFLAHDPQTRNPILMVRAGRFSHLRNSFMSRDSTDHDGNNNINVRSLPINKGLEPRLISSIPEFVYRSGQEGTRALECVICLSLFKNGEKGRKLGLCQHCFHVECIDMWLHSHKTCPICRAPAVKEKHEISDEKEEGTFGEGRFESNSDAGTRLEIIVEVSDHEEINGSLDQTSQSNKLVRSSTANSGNEI